MTIPSLTKTLSNNRVLRFPSVELTPGNALCIMGQNGAGKSTFCKIIAGILPCDSGKYLTLPGIRIGYLPQKVYPFRMSVEANLLLGSRDRNKAARLMQTLRIEHLKKKQANKLSGGETACVALGRVLMKDFDLLILDEPTAAMDAQRIPQVESAIKHYMEETNCALILVTHSQAQANIMADQILYLSAKDDKAKK